MNRQTLIWGTVVALLLAFAMVQAEEKVNILLIGKEPDHPDGSHMYLHTCGVLAKCLEKTSSVRASVSKGWPEDPKQLENVRAIVIYTSPAAELLLDGPQRDAALALLKKDVGLVTIHWASTVKKENLERLGPTWLTILGGTWISNVGLSSGKSPLVRLEPDHPICRGWEEYEIDDEYYLNPLIEKGTPLLKVTEPKDNKEVIVGWTFEREGGGRSFATTLGHPYRNFQREPFRRMIVNGILWSAKVEVPEYGAAVDIAESDLALPSEQK